MKLQIWSRLLEKSLMKNFIFCAVILSDSFNFLRSLNDFFSEHGYNFDVIKIGYTRPS